MGFIETLNARAERHVFRLPLHTLTAADTGSSTPYDAVEGGRGGIPHSPYLVDERPRGSSSAALRATPMAASDHLRARRLAAPPAANRPGGKRYDLLHALDADLLHARGGKRRTELARCHTTGGKATCGSGSRPGRLRPSTSASAKSYRQNREELRRLRKVCPLARRGGLVRARGTRARRPPLRPSEASPARGVRGHSHRMIQAGVGASGEGRAAGESHTHSQGQMLR